MFQFFLVEQRRRRVLQEIYCEAPAARSPQPVPVADCVTAAAPLCWNRFLSDMLPAAVFWPSPGHRKLLVTTDQDLGAF